MINREEKERFRSLSAEERKAELMDHIGDSIRREVKHIAMEKAIARNECGISPEEFDASLKKEFEKAWNNVKDKDSVQLAIMGLFEMMTNGADPKELLGGLE